MKPREGRGRGRGKRVGVCWEKDAKWMPCGNEWRRYMPGKKRQGSVFEYLDILISPHDNITNNSKTK